VEGSAEAEGASEAVAPRAAGEMQLRRALRHLLTTHWSGRRHFPQPVLEEITRAIREAESTHAAQLRFVVESALDLPHLWRSTTPRRRALQLFGELGIWDTAANNGVLIYLLLADRVVEIIADRGIAARVSQSEWESVCRQMERHFSSARFRDGSIGGIQAVAALLAKHFPGSLGGVNELPDKPVIL
jgi:hypothetical protein